MVKGKCEIRTCEFIVEDGQHVDDVLAQMHEHWRAQHPTKFFKRATFGDRVVTYNQTWDEVMVNYYGPDWANNRQAEADPYTLQEISNALHYSPEVNAKAKELWDAIQAAAPQRENAEVRRRRNRDRLHRGVGQNVAPQPPIQWIPEAGLAFPVQDNGPELAAENDVEF